MPHDFQPCDYVGKGTPSSLSESLSSADRATRESRTPTETMVAEVWCDVLGLEEISINDNFFKAGGHSLAAVQVVHELGARTGLDLELETFFDIDTLAGIAAELDRRQAINQDSGGSQYFEGEF